MRRRALHIRHVAQEEKCHEVTLGRLLFKFRHEFIVYRTLRRQRAAVKYQEDRTFGRPYSRAGGGSTVDGCAGPRPPTQRRYHETFLLARGLCPVHL